MLRINEIFSKHLNVIKQRERAKIFYGALQINSTKSEDSELLLLSLQRYSMRHLLEILVSFILLHFRLR